MTTIERDDRADPTGAGASSAEIGTGSADGPGAARGPIRQPKLTARGWLRWAWRQLTSMRTALFLLLLLAVAAVPGSVFPQRSIDAPRVNQFLAENPGVGPWLDRFSFFDVFESPWFSAIYLLLVVSLLGCIVPRIGAHWRDLRAQPPKTPAHPARLPYAATIPRTQLLALAPATPTASAVSTTATLSAAPADIVAAAAATLKSRRYRVVASDEGTVSAEGGFLRETGNLLFHVGLCAVIIGVAVGHLYGWRGDVIVPAGESFSSTVSSYDTVSWGPMVDPEQFAPFSVRVDKFDAVFEDRLASQMGMPRSFTAYTTITDRPGASARTEELSVNHPVAVDGATVFLLGNGYAPVVTVKDASGKVLFHQRVPFLPRDNTYTSTGAIKVTALPAGKQIGLSGVFLPTAEPTWKDGPVSLFPDLRNPELGFTVWEGELMPGGQPQSVYTLDTAKLTQITSANGKPVVLRLRPGETVQLPGGRGSVTFDTVVRWAGLSVRSDPATMFTMISALLTVAGLIATLLVRRRRVFVRVTPDAVEIGGLAKSSDPGVERVVDQVRDGILERVTPATPRGAARGPDRKERA